MKYEISDEEFLEEVEKLPQLDRIEFRQRRIYYLNTLADGHIYIGLSLIIMILCLSLIFLSYSYTGEENIEFFFYAFMISLLFIIAAFDIISQNRKNNQAKEMEQKVIKKYLKVGVKSHKN